MRENNPAVLYFECEVVYSSFSNSLLPLPLHFFFPVCKILCFTVIK